MLNSKKSIWQVSGGSLAFMLLSTFAHTQTVPVTECDTLTAHPSDPQRVTGGIEFEGLDAAPAIRACEQSVERFPNSARLIFQLGRAYDRVKDVASAEKWYRRAADLGYGAAQYNLGLMYWEGVDVSRDDATAIRWFRLAAEQGHVDAQYVLGLVYSSGDGAERDEARAMRWFRRAAEQGHAGAQLSLAKMHIDPSIIFLVEGDSNFPEALKWLHLSANQGNNGAQNYLGILYAGGMGVLQDNISAYMWFTIADKLGNNSSRIFRDYVQESMTHDEILLADQRAREWIEKHQAQ